METYFRNTSYGLVATAFAALALTGELDGVSVALYGAALAVSYWADWRGSTRLRLREWMWFALAAAYVPFAFFDVTFISASWVLALVHATLFLSAAKLFQDKRDRDWVFLYLIAFFQMLLAAGLTFDATFVGALLVFLFFFVSTLAAFEIRRSRQALTALEEDVITRRPRKSSGGRRAAGQATRLPARRLRYLAGASLAQMAIVAALSVPLFFLIPRFGSGGLASGLADGNAMTGFSETVRLGEVAQIKESQRIVMRVELPSRPPRYLRWRGTSLDRYEGNTWVNTQGNGSTGNEGTNIEDERFIQRHILATGIDQRGLLQQKISREPLGTGTLFAARRVARVEAPLPILYLKAADVINKEDVTMVSAPVAAGRLTYTAYSLINIPDEQTLQAEPTPEQKKTVSESYLRLPKIDPRIDRLARELTRNAPTAYDKARAIEKYLKTEFRYTLNLTPAGHDPLAEFLFDTREGHCEYFATAMTVMLRTLKIPARLVNGFQMGERNELNGQYAYTVRERDAHSWVEVYFPQADAWVEFDPTPAAGLNDYSQGGLLAQLRKYMDAMQVFWLDYVVTLDSDEQQNILADMQRRLMAAKNWGRGHYLAAKLWLKRQTSGLLRGGKWTLSDFAALGGVLVLMLMLPLAAYVAVAYRRQRGRPPTGYGPWWRRLFILPLWRRAARPGRDPRACAVLFYEQMLAVMARAGRRKRPDQTPAEFAAAAGYWQVGEITALYNRVRFGGAPLSDPEGRRVADLLAELRQAVRDSGARGQKSESSIPQSAIRNPHSKDSGRRI